MAVHAMFYGANRVWLLLRSIGRLTDAMGVRA